jgi:amidase
VWSGSAYLARRDHRASADAPIATAIRNAGFVVCGRSTCSELAATPTSEPAAFPAVRNPWATERVAGGSSGGSAAAVACRAVPIAHGNDTGGSLRIPAAACGVVGFKPTRGRMPLDPLLAAVEPGLGLTSDFFLTRSVRDTSALLQVFGAAEPGALGATARAAPSSGELRIGVHTSASNVGIVTDPSCIAAVERALEMLEGFGHHIVETRPLALDDPGLAAVTLPLVACAMAGTLHRLTSEVGTPPAEDELEPYTRAMVEMGRRTSFVGYAEHLDRLRDYSNRVLHGWQGIDLLVTPTLAELPPPIGAFTRDGEPMWPMVRSAPQVCFTAPFNLTGQPAISLPLWHDEDSGLPVGVQIVGLPGHDETLLGVAAELEAAVPRPDPPTFGRQTDR